MSELARRRNARDMWISRGHLAAAASGAASLAVASFAVGVFLGTHRRAPEVDPAPFTPDDSLVELLARVETTAALPGGVDEAMTFPDLLRDGGPKPKPPPAESARPPEQLDLGAGAPVLADAPPPGEFTLVVARGDDADTIRAEVADLRQRGLAAWVSAAIVDGRWSYRVAVGGYPDEAAARHALALARAAEVPAAVEPLRLKVQAAPVPAAPAAPAPAIVRPAPALPPEGEAEAEGPGVVSAGDEGEVLPPVEGVASP
ncbi:MAG: SPOR domain-containing protein [Myxococcota bacterium]